MKITKSVFIRIVIWIVLIIGGIVLSLFFDLKYFKNFLFYPLFHFIAFVFGVFVLKLSFHAASVGGKTLKKYGRKGNIPRLETNMLVTEGIYKCTRHPMFLGLMLFPLGIGLILGLPTFMFFIAPLESLLILSIGIWLDEKEAIKKFGNEYLKYKKSTPVFPNRECLKKLFFD